MTHGTDTAPPGPEETEPAAGTVTAETDRRGRRRRNRILIPVGMTVLLVTGTTAAILAHRDTDGPRPQTEPSAQTAKITRTDLSNSQTFDGVLGYGVPTTVRAQGGGTVTWLASNGTKVTRGEALYRIDDRPVPVLYGTLPLYRRLATAHTVGRDVRLLADNLRALGYDIGRQPAAGETILVQPAATEDRAPQTGSNGSETGKPESPDADAESEGDTAGPSTTASAGPTPAAPTRVKVGRDDCVLTESLIAAVKRWQTALGVPATGVVEMNDVIVVPGQVRVNAAEIQVGQPADGPLLRVTSTGKVVTVPVDATESGGIRRGQRATIRLPDGTSVHGKVASVANSAALADEPGDDSNARVNVTVKLDDPAGAEAFDSAPVQVDFVHETRRDVLAVPITALLALREGGYAVQHSDGRLTAVTTGLFAKGQVEITGKDITEGDRVVVAS